MRSFSTSRWLLALLLATSVRAAAQDAGQLDDVTVTQMDGVGGLRVDGCRLDGGAAAAVFGRAGLAGTRELWLADTHMTRGGLDALLASPVARDVEVVWLNDRVMLEPGGIRGLLRLPRLRRLHPASQVDASPDELVDANALGRKAPATVALDLERFSDDQLGRMAWSSARALRVAVQARGDQLVRLERTGVLKMVSELDGTCPASCIRRLARSGRLGALESLALNCHHTVETARALAGARLPRLRSLALTYDAETCQDDQGRARRGIGPAGVTALLAAPWAAQLRELRLVGQQLGEPGAGAIAAAPQLAGLRVLVIGTGSARRPRRGAARGCGDIRSGAGDAAPRRQRRRRGTIDVGQRGAGGTGPERAAARTAHARGRLQQAHRRSGGARAGGGGVGAAAAPARGDGASALRIARAERAGGAGVGGPVYGGAGICAPSAVVRVETSADRCGKLIRCTGIRAPLPSIAITSFCARKRRTSVSNRRTRSRRR